MSKQDAPYRSLGKQVEQTPTGSASWEESQHAPVSEEPPRPLHETANTTRNSDVLNRFPRPGARVPAPALRRSPTILRVVIVGGVFALAAAVFWVATQL